MPAGVYYDGDFSIPTAIGPVRTSQPIDFQPHCQMYRQAFCQLATCYAPLPINSPLSLIDPTEAPGITGTWTLSFRGQTTAALAAKETAANIQTALNALTSLATGTVEVAGDWDHGYAVTFHPAVGHPIQPNRNLLQANMSGISPAYKAKIMLASTPPAVQSVRPIAVNTTGALSGAVLVQETERQDMGGAGLVQWDRVYSNIPSSYVEYQGYNYQMQRMQTYRVLWNSWTDPLSGQLHQQYINFIRLSEYTEPLIATVAYSFCLGNNLNKKGNPFYLPYRIIHYTDSFGVEYVYAVGTWSVAEGTTAERWMGDIWRVRNVIVSPY